MTGHSAGMAVEVGVARLHPGDEALQQARLLVRAEAADELLCLAHRPNHVAGRCEPALGVPAMQKTPDHQLAEQEIIGTGPLLPDHATQTRGAKRQAHAESNADQGRRDGPGGAQPPDEPNRSSCDEQRRGENLQQLLAGRDGFRPLHRSTDPPRESPPPAANPDRLASRGACVLQAIGDYLPPEPPVWDGPCLLRRFCRFGRNSPRGKRHESHPPRTCTTESYMAADNGPVLTVSPFRPVSSANAHR